MTGGPWPLRRLDEVCEVVLGQSPPGSSYNTEGEGMPFFQGKAEFGEWFPTVRKWTTAPKKRAQQGDVLISVRAPVGPTNIAPVDCAIGRGLAAIRPQEGLLPKYLIYALRHSQQALVDEGTGTTFEAITGAKLRAHEIPIAPPDEQRQIVEAIETHLSHLDAGVESLQRAKRNLKRMHSASLATALGGRLTSKGGKGEHGFPEHWSVSTLEEVTDPERLIQYGILMPKEHQPDGVPVVKVRNISNDGDIDIEGLQRTSPEIEAKYARSRLRGGDVLVTIRGTYGRVAEVPPALDGANITQDTARVAPLGFVRTDFLIAFLRSPLAQRYFSRVARGVGVKGVNIGDLRKLSVPIPPAGEQERIAERCAEILSMVRHVRDTTAVGIQRAASLRSALLASAFSGRLVSSDEGQAA